jgi:sarcosine oxidase subunit beta
MTAQRVDCLVVGGGIVGTGIAYYLAREGVGEVLLVEAAHHGAGATGGSFGNIRQQFGTPLEVECSRRGLEFWKTAESQFGVPCTFHEDGYLMLTADESTAEVLERHAGVQKEAGMANVHLLSPREIADLVPFVATGNVISGSWTPEDGHVMPMDGVAAYVSGAKALGVRIQEQFPIARLERKGDGWHAYGPHEIVAAKVVLAAGIGTRRLVADFGLDLDMTEVDHFSMLTGPAFGSLKIPTVIDLDTGMCVEREGPGLVLAMLSRNPVLRDHDHLAEVFFEAAETRAPSLIDLPLTHRLTAYPTVGGDGHPYIGVVDQDLWAVAFVGHGVMHGPPVAEALAREVAGNPDPTLDLSPWDIHRTPGERSVLWRRRAQG